MDQNMFCFQCEQTAGCTGCTGKSGVCGKTDQTARLQDELTGAMIGLARVAEGGLKKRQTGAGMRHMCIYVQQDRRR